jgi:hypothetical protein
MGLAFFYETTLSVSDNVILLEITLSQDDKPVKHRLLPSAWPAGINRLAAVFTDGY